MVHDFEILMYHKERERDLIETANRIRRNAVVRKRRRAERRRAVLSTVRGLSRGWVAFRDAWRDERARNGAGGDSSSLGRPAA